VPAPTLRRNRQIHELSYREICEIMGLNLRVIVAAEPEPEQEQLELFDAAQGGRQ
jgi:hypothetical protein